MMSKKKNTLKNDKDNMFSSDEDEIDDTQFIDESYFKVFVTKEAYDKEMDYVQQTMRDEILEEAEGIIQDTVADLVMTAIEDTKESLTTTLETTIMENTDKVTKMMKTETAMSQRLIKEIREITLPQFTK